MATSKHFPVQKYSPRDTEDYIYNETPYNSVSSFKSYHSNQNKNNSDSVAPQYDYENEINNATPFIPYSRSNVTRSTHQVPYIDNTVVSAYKGSKPPIPTQKPKIPKASASNLQARRTDNVTTVNSECQERKKFGIEQLQLITKRLQNENKELRRHRNSKGHEEVPLVVAESGTPSRDSGRQGESVKEQSLQRETGAPSPDNGRHSSMSRRRLPKVPDGTNEPKILPNVIKDTDKVPSISVKGTSEVPNINLNTETGKDSSEVELRSKLPGSVSSENKLSGNAALGSAESQRNRITRKLGKHRRRDKERSKSLGDQAGSFTQDAVKNLMMSGLSKKETVVDRLDLDRSKNEDVSSANEDIADSEASSHQDSSISSRYSADITTDKSNSDNKMANEMATFENPEVVLHGDKGRGSDSECVSGFASASVKLEGNKYGHPDSKMIDCSQEDYSVVASLNDIVDNAAGENLLFSFDHEVIQELTDSVMGNGENLEKTKYEKQESNENFMNFDADVDRIAANEEKQIIEGKSFCLKNYDESKEVPSLTNTRNETNNHIEKLNCEVPDKETKDDSFKGNVMTTVKPQKKKVERSPSYRKKVMARAKSRYKKSSMLKECSCTKNENGEIVVCQFCENYENRKNRSKSSLGLETVGLVKDVAEVSEGENSEISSYSEISSPRRAFTPGLPPLPSSKSPRPLRKLQVSSRVDVLMSSDLFRKHLNKHENLLQKHTMFRRAGIRKSVSNLDLSEGYVIDSDSQCETESVASDAYFENDWSTKDDILNQFHDFTQSNKESRRHSLSGDSDITEEKTNKSKKKHFRTLPSSVGRSRPPIPSFSQLKSRPNIPTYHEFKVMKELSKSTEALNFEGTESENVYSNLDCKTINSEYDKDLLKKQEKHKIEEKSEIVDQNRNVESVPLQLQVIKESLSRENLLTIENTESGDTVETKKDHPSDNRRNNSEVKSTKPENVPIKQSEGLINGTSDKIMNDRKGDFKSIDESRKVSAMDKYVDKVDGHEHLIRQQSAPNLKPHQQRVRPKLKSRTLSRLDQDSECLSDTASGVVNKSGSLREHRKHGAKRPRSLISKKSSLMSLIQEAGSKGQNLEDGESSSEKSINSRPKLKVGHNVNRSQSDSKYEMGKAKNMHQDEDENRLSRHLLSLDKGKNSVSFDLEDTSQCSPFDIGESETSTSLAESLSDSIRSEVNVEDYLQHPSDQDDTGKLLHDQDDVVADDSSVLKPLKEELVSQVLRSTSDACEITQEAARKRRERKERPYKSDPFSGTEIIPASKRCVIREEKAKLRQHMDFANSSKEEILTFLDGVSHGDIAACDSIPSLEELNEDDEQLQLMSDSSRKLRKHHSNVSSLSTDSGVIGQDGSHDSQQSSPTNTLSHSQSEQTISSLQPMNKKRSQSASNADLSSKEIQECASCGPQDNMLDVHRSQICAQCLSRRRERREIVQEIVDTEMNYGRDLNILKEEFYKPIMKAGLLNKEQLDAIFLNLDELIHVNKHFITKLKSAIHTANQNNDNELEEVMIGCLFLESSTMFLTFENYCVNQAQAPVLLEQLEREKELLRIFLQVSQNDNHQLRRMHLKSFLMVPVQRIMKYPLLLDRLYKTTPVKHVDKTSLKEAKEKIEDILGHINAKSRTVSFRQRKPSQKSSQHCSVTEKIEVSRVALETLQWNRKDVCDVITSQLYVTQPVDHTWAVKKCKNYKFTPVYGVLLTLMQQPNETANDNDINRVRNSQNLSNNENNNTRVKSAAVVFIKEKSGRYQVMREPFMLEKCVVSQDPEYLDVFEILEWSKEAFLIKADTPQETKLWVQNLRQQMNNLGFWRKRRNALPNILLNHLS